MIVHTPEPGPGAGQYVAEFVKALAVDGPTILLFCPSNFAYEQDLKAHGVEVIHAPVREIKSASLLRRVVRNLTFIADSVPKFWATVRKGDIVHFQFTQHLGLSLFYLAMARLKRASVVLTVHDPLPHSWILPRAFRWMETMLLAIQYSWCHRLIVHNEAGKQILAKHFFPNSTGVAVIPHGPFNSFPNGTFNRQPRTLVEPLRLLAFGSLRENKGLHLSITAVQRLRQNTTNRPIFLTIAGSPPNSKERGYWERCLRLIKAQPDGIEVLERVIDDSEVGALFAAHDAILLPYVDFHSDSGVAMLALSQGRPILATSAGGLGELLRETDCGILIQSPTLDAVIAAINDTARMPPGVLRRKGWNGYSHAQQHRSWKAIAERTRALYEDLSSEGGTRGLEPKNPAERLVDSTEEARKLTRASHE